MENATKALVIAGAVLITILLISVGIMVFNASRDPLDDVNNNTASYRINQFNSKFSEYLGEKTPGSSVKSLLAEINTSNATNETHQVTTAFSGNPSSTATYKVEAKYGTDGESKGYITEIVITKN